MAIREFISTLFHIDNKLHLWMNSTKNSERPWNRKENVSHAAGILIAGVKRKYFRLYIGVVLKIRIVINNPDCFSGRYI